MLECTKIFMSVLFKPPANAYSRYSRQSQFANQIGELEAMSGLRARVLFNGTSINVNPDYLYDINSLENTEIANAIFVGKD